MVELLRECLVDKWHTVALKTVAELTLVVATATPTWQKSPATALPLKGLRVKIEMCCTISVCQLEA